MLLCLVLSLGVFSVSASAESTDIGQLSIYENHALMGKNLIGGNLTYTTSNGDKETLQGNYSTDKSSLTTSNYLQQYLIVRPVDGSIMAESKIKTTITLENIYTSYLLTGGGVHVYAYSPNYVQFQIVYIDGTTEYVTGSILGPTSDFEKTYKVTFTPSKDVKYFYVRVRTPLYEHIPDDWTNFSITSYLGETNGDGRIKLTIDQPSEEAGLLEGIWGSLASGFDNLAQKLQSVVDTITNLPSKIWEFIENGLKSLFIPDDDFITGYKERFLDLLSEKFGAVYQVVEMTFGAWEDITLADLTDTIEMPEVTIDLPEDNTFSFGGMDVKIVPQGFEFIVDTLKLIVGIACSFLFVNGLRKRYDEVMGVEK